MIPFEESTNILNRFFDKYDFSPKDRYEIAQIYSLLPEEKQKNIIKNFDILAIKIQKIEDDIQIEQEILIGEALSNIRIAIEEAKKRKWL